MDIGRKAGVWASIRPGYGGKRLWVYVAHDAQTIRNADYPQSSSGTEGCSPPGSGMTFWLPTPTAGMIGNGRGGKLNMAQERQGRERKEKFSFRS